MGAPPPKAIPRPKPTVCDPKVDSLTGALYLTAMEWDDELDAIGLLCPLPVLKARKRLMGLSSGQVLRVVASDPAAVIDMPHFCAEAGHDLIGTSEAGDAQVYLIRKGQSPKSA